MKRAYTRPGQRPWSVAGIIDTPCGELFRPSVPQFLTALHYNCKQQNVLVQTDMNGKYEVVKSPKTTDVGFAAREMIQLQKKVGAQ